MDLAEAAQYLGLPRADRLQPRRARRDTRDGLAHANPPVGARQAGLSPLRPHDLRHTAVSLWAPAGATPNEVAARAGHTSVAVVLDRYWHLFSLRS